MTAKVQKEIYFFMGTVAELIKISPVIDKLNKRGVSFKIITSGQVEINFNELEYLIGNQAPFYTFKPKSKEFSSVKFAFWALKTLLVGLFCLREEFRGKNKQNSYMIVHGDTVSTVIGALLAKWYGLKLAHIESGVRSFNFFEPFPEEVDRCLVSLLADVNFCPNDWAANNIRSAPGVKVNTGQNTAYDVFLSALKQNTSVTSFKPPKDSKYYLLLLHRQEHMLYKKHVSKMYIKEVTSFAKPSLKCVFITHHLVENLLREEKMLSKIQKNPDVIISPRLPFLEFIQVLKGAEFIASDGGGNQPESYYLGKPCLILRKYTEQTEGIGSNAVLAKDDPKIVREFLNNYQSKKRPPVSVKQLPSTTIVDYLTRGL